MTNIPSKQAISSKIGYFLCIYSAVGIVALIITLSSLVIIAEDVLEIFRAYNDALVGNDVRRFENGFNAFPTFFLAFLVVCLLLYFYIGSLLVIYYRLKLHRLLARGEFSFVQAGSKLVLKFKEKIRSGPFLVLAELNLVNFSAGGRRLAYLYQPKAYYSEGEVVFDLSELNTGRYEIKSILFTLKDPLGLFAGKEKYLEPNMTPLNIANYNSFYNEQLAKKIDFYLDSERSSLSLMPSEGYFGTREYRFGDELKKIHWKNTAKQGELMIKTPEEKPEDDRDLNIVINLYTPYLYLADQSKSIGQFLDQVFAGIKKIISQTENRVHLYLNGLEMRKIVDFHSYNQDKLVEIILARAVFQDYRPLKTFLKKIEVENLVIFSLSTDDLLLSPQFERETRIKYLYNSAKDHQLKLKAKLKNLYVYEKEPRFVSLKNFFDAERFNQIFSVLPKNLERLIIKNEARYVQNPTFTILNKTYD
jgi:hypothetical protein